MSATAPATRFGSGRSVRRVEDPALVQGRGRFAGDVTLPGQTWLAFLRSDRAHARIVSIDSRQAAAMPGVLALYSGADLAAAGVLPLALQAANRSVSTIEALAQGGRLHAVQEAFVACHGLQCGYCTPGMVMSACALLQTNPRPSEAEIVHALEGNLCRCTGYVNIVAAVQQAARSLSGDAP